MASLSNNDIARAVYLVCKDKTGANIQSAGQMVARFLYRKRLLSRKRAILLKLEKTINEENQVVSAEVRAAEPLSENAKTKIRIFLKERYRSREAVLKEIIDKNLFGGFKIEVKDEVIDLSVKNKIKKLQEHLTRVS